MRSFAQRMPSVVFGVLSLIAAVCAAPTSPGVDARPANPSRHRENRDSRTLAEAELVPPSDPAPPTPLAWAALSGDLVMVRSLLESGANLNESGAATTVLMM